MFAAQVAVLSLALVFGVSVLGYIIACGLK
jgi:hypothetical protein